MRKKDFGCHSERSEASLLVQNKRQRGILRAKAALRMTAFGLFPQTGKPAPKKIRASRADGSAALTTRARPSEED
jgi:hypothetical protein